MKKLLLIFASLFAAPVHAAEMVNVEYIHQAIEQRWGITIPYNPALENPKVAANMEYLLTAVDRANAVLNGTATHYGTGEYATHAAADTIATNRAVAELIQIKPKFWVTTTADTADFEFAISAQGTFAVDWGDNTPPQIIVKETVGPKNIPHEYSAPGARTIAIGGRATRYTNTGAAAVSFRDNKNIAGISGSLGMIFKTIGRPVSQDYGGQPRFTFTFSGCANLGGEIPPELFQGIRGLPSRNMFFETFDSCTGLTGKIPAGLFGKLSGAPADNMFYATFRGCKNLTGPIPDGLFDGLSGAPSSGMFDSTFFGCSNLSGEIPGKLFAEISGKPATGMFKKTFSGCSSLTGEIPDDLFGDISGDPAEEMFFETFYGCSQLSGPSARINGAPLYKIWPDISNSWCYYGATGLSDYPDIPENWK